MSIGILAPVPLLSGLLALAPDPSPGPGAIPGPIPCSLSCSLSCPSPGPGPSPGPSPCVVACRGPCMTNNCPSIVDSPAHWSNGTSAVPEAWSEPLSLCEPWFKELLFKPLSWSWAEPFSLSEPLSLFRVLDAMVAASTSGRSCR